jgi:hypothetical protein
MDHETKEQDLAVAPEHLELGDGTVLILESDHPGHRSLVTSAPADSSGLADPAKSADLCLSRAMAMGGAPFSGYVRTRGRSSL